MIAYRKIEGAIESLANSTARTLELRGETIDFNGLNSPFVSHQNVVVTYGHNVDKLVIIRNERYDIALMPSWSVLSVTGKHFKVSLPAHFVKPLFQFPARAPQWVDGLINVIIPNDFAKFDDDGAPIFLESNEVKIVDDHKGITLQAATEKED